MPIEAEEALLPVQDEALLLVQDADNDEEHERTERTERMTRRYPFVRNLCVILTLTIVHIALIGFGIYSIVYIVQEWMTIARKDWQQHFLYFFAVLSTSLTLILVIASLKQCLQDCATEFETFFFFIGLRRYRRRRASFLHREIMQ